RWLTAPARSTPARPPPSRWQPAPRRTPPQKAWTRGWWWRPRGRWTSSPAAGWTELGPEKERTGEGARSSFRPHKRSPPLSLFPAYSSAHARLRARATPGPGHLHQGDGDLGDHRLRAGLRLPRLRDRGVPDPHRLHGPDAARRPHALHEPTDRLRVGGHTQEDRPNRPE